MCKHPVEQLVGCEDGIRCRACGQLFKDFPAVEKDRKADEKPKKKEASKDE